MNSTDPLANLRDIHLPAEISWWPLAPGWWILIALIIALLVWSGYKFWQQHKKQALVREVKDTLTSLESIYREDNNSRQLISEYAQLLRRLMIHAYSREETAGKTGQDWLDLLCQQVPEHTLEAKYLVLLGDGHYQKELPEKDIDPLINWVNNCAVTLSKQAIRSHSNA